MAIARITQRWADGGECVTEIHVAASYPDAIDEARVAVVKLWRETCTEQETES